MKVNRVNAIIGVVLGTMSKAEAGRETMTIEEGGITFSVDRYDDGRSKPYRVIFTDNDAESTYKFNTDGFVTNIQVGSETYKVLYKSNGDLKKVKLTPSDRRNLWEEIDNTEHALDRRHSRRLYDCDDCVEAWDAVCDEGVPSVCALMGYGSPLLSAAESSIATMSETFGNACSSYGGLSACAGQCTEEDCGDACVLNSTCSADGECICDDGFVGDGVTYCTGLNSCLDVTNGDFRCSSAGGSTGLDLTDCGLVDSDTEYLPACFENFVKENIVKLSISRNSELTSLPSDVFSGLTNLVTLWLYDNQLAEISVDLFSGLTILHTLWLHGNQLEVLPMGVFSNLAVLDTLTIYSNQLKELEEGIFEGLTGLQGLNLHDNLLTELSENVFSGLDQSWIIYLHENELTTLSEGTFSGLPELQFLWLQNNSLTTLPEGVFSDLPKLNFLYLTDNAGLQCLPTSSASNVELDTEDVRQGTCECEPAEAITCSDGESCVAGGVGYTCE